MRTRLRSPRIAGRTRLGERVRPALFLALPRVAARSTLAPLPTPSAVLRIAFLALVLFASGCAPSITPTYRDYRISAPPAQTASPQSASPQASRDDAERLLLDALAEAGWEIAERDAPNVISTEPRRIDSGLFSSVDATLDLAPLGDRFVRVYVHATRRNIFGGRTKQPYLSRGLRRAALAELTDALAKRGLAALDAPRDRDEEATE